MKSTEGAGEILDGRQCLVTASMLSDLDVEDGIGWDVAWVHGVVRWFGATYGFVEGPDGSDVFVHQSRIKMRGFRSLREGERVRYLPVAGPKGVAASIVVVV